MSQESSSAPATDRRVSALMLRSVVLRTSGLGVLRCGPVLLFCAALLLVLFLLLALVLIALLFSLFLFRCGDNITLVIG